MDGPKSPSGHSLGEEGSPRSWRESNPGLSALISAITLKVFVSFTGYEDISRTVFTFAILLLLTGRISCTLSYVNATMSLWFCFYKRDSQNRVIALYRISYIRLLLQKLCSQFETLDSLRAVGSISVAINQLKDQYKMATGVSNAFQLVLKLISICTV
jgi:hypothetical protein